MHEVLGMDSVKNHGGDVTTPEGMKRCRDRWFSSKLRLQPEHSLRMTNPNCVEWPHTNASGVVGVEIMQPDTL